LCVCSVLASRIDQRTRRWGRDDPTDDRAGPLLPGLDPGDHRQRAGGRDRSYRRGQVLQAARVGLGPDGPVRRARTLCPWPTPPSAARSSRSPTRPGQSVRLPGWSRTRSCPRRTRPACMPRHDRDRDANRPPGDGHPPGHGAGMDADRRGRPHECVPGPQRWPNRPSTQFRSSWVDLLRDEATTTTGQTACSTAAWLTDPSSSSEKPPRPRATTSRSIS
jgi:hypothetical protein